APVGNAPRGRDPPRRSRRLLDQRRGRERPEEHGALDAEDGEGARRGRRRRLRRDGRRDGGGGRGRRRHVRRRRRRRGRSLGALTVRSPVPAAPAANTIPRPPAADVLASIDDALIVLARPGNVLGVNPAAEELTGVSLSQALGTEVGALFRASPWVADMARGTLAAGAARRRSEGQLASRRGGEVP